MTKQQQTIYMSIVPLIIIIALILGAGYFLLEGEITLPKFDNTPKIRRLEGFPTIVYTDDEQRTKIRKIIKNEQEMNDFLNEVDSSGLLTVREDIDFEKEYLIAISSDTFDETGHRIKVRKLYTDNADNSLLVSIQQDDPGESCDEDPDKNIGVDLVAVTKTDLKVDFEREKKVVECD